MTCFVKSLLHLGTLGLGILDFLAGLGDLLLAGVALVAGVIVGGAVLHGLLNEFALDLVTNGLLHIGVLVGLIRVGLHDLNTVSLFNSDLTRRVLRHEDVNVLIGGGRDGDVGASLGTLLRRGSSCGRSRCFCFWLSFSSSSGLGISSSGSIWLGSSIRLGSIGGLVASRSVSSHARDNLVEGIDQDGVLVFGLNLSKSLIKRGSNGTGKLFTLNEHGVGVGGSLHEGHSVKRKSHFCSFYLCLNFYNEAKTNNSL